MTNGSTDTGPHQVPLRDRLPDYAAIAGVGLFTSWLVGVGIGVVSSAPIAHAVGYTLVVVGAVWLLSGGLTGGGYSVFGVGEGVGRRTYIQGDGNQAVMESLRRGTDPRRTRGHSGGSSAESSTLRSGSR